MRPAANCCKRQTGPTFTRFQACALPAVNWIRHRSLIDAELSELRKISREDCEAKQIESHPAWASVSLYHWKNMSSQHPPMPRRLRLNRSKSKSNRKRRCCLTSRKLDHFLPFRARLLSVLSHTDLPLGCDMEETSCSNTSRACSVIAANAVIGLWTLFWNDSKMPFSASFSCKRWHKFHKVAESFV